MLTVKFDTGEKYDLYIWLVLLSGLLAILKTAGAISLSWFWVLFPALLPWMVSAGLLVCILFGVLMVAVLAFTTFLFEELVNFCRK